ncbi:MAG: hypothetical protein UD963_01915 [Christensenellales bacterium]|nr:hypothetical protein [Christensenellales bacterium]
MGTLADSLFNVLMSWVRALVNSIWALFTTDHMTLLEFLGKNWVMLVVIMLAAGLVIDWLVWLVRWKPYHLWARRVRRFLHLPSPEEEEEEERKQRKKAKRQPSAPVEEEQWDESDEEQWLPLEQPRLDARQEQEVMRQAESVPDAELGAYPGMKYGAQAAPRENMESTQRYAAVHSEGPGAAEVERRKAEIAAWQLQMQEEARQKAEAERAAREEEQRRAAAQKAYEEEQRRAAAQKAYEEEQRRIAAQKAYEEEQRRIAAQKAYEDEQARLAQEEYQRQLAEYERQKAQYEQDMARYRQEKAAYDAQMAQQSQQNTAETPSARRHRTPQRPMTYSDYVSGETVEKLPDPPRWPQVQQAAEQTRTAAEKPTKAKKQGGLMGRMAKLIEEEDENDVSGIASLPPRVNVHDAYRPAKTPQKTRKR